MIRTVAFLCTLLSTQVAFGFCGLYVSGSNELLSNDATQVILARDGTQTTMTLKPDYIGAKEDFMVVLPVPEKIESMSFNVVDADIFRRLDQLTAPRLVEYEWSLCQDEPKKQRLNFSRSISSYQQFLSLNEKTFLEPDRFFVSGYDVEILDEVESANLIQSLSERQFHVPETFEALIEPHIQRGMHFVLVRVHPGLLYSADGRYQLDPIQITFDSDDFGLPVQLGSGNGRAHQDLLVHVIGKQRYEVSNKPNVTAPTNYDLTEAVKKTGFPNFYVSMFDAIIEKNRDAVVTEYAWRTAECDPCPTGGSGFSSVNMADLLMLGYPKSEAIVTRLHARFDGQHPGDDLIFREAKPIEGGLESTRYHHTAQLAQTNRFQSRFVLRNSISPSMCKNKPASGVVWTPKRDEESGILPPLLADDNAYLTNRDVVYSRFVKPRKKMVPKITLDFYPKK